MTGLLTILDTTEADFYTNFARWSDVGVQVSDNSNATFTKNETRVNVVTKTISGNGVCVYCTIEGERFTSEFEYRLCVECSKKPSALTMSGESFQVQQTKGLEWDGKRATCNVYLNYNDDFDEETMDGTMKIAAYFNNSNTSFDVYNISIWALPET